MKRIHRARSRDEIARIYDEWGEDYERETMRLGYSMPAIVAGLFGRYVSSREGKILDVGAGTGILGEMLYLLGFRNLTAMDFSQAMLEVCRTRGVYDELCEAILGEKLGFPDATFDAVAVMGVYGKGHAPAHSLMELTRITRPCGHIIFSIRVDEYEAEGFKKLQGFLEEERVWTLVEVTEPFDSMPLDTSGIMNLIFVYRVL